MSLREPVGSSDPGQAVEVAPGRRAPFTQVGDWVLLSGVDSDARTLYWALSAHLNASREDNEVWPSLLTLARILGLRKPENVSKYMLQLEVIGAVEVIRTTAGLVRRNRYVVHQTPPPGYSGPQSMADWYALNRPPSEEAAPEREAREADFEEWLAETRRTIKSLCKQTAEARALARRNRDRTVPTVPFRGPAPRTPPSGGTAGPGNSRLSAGEDVPLREGVRAPSRRGQVPLREGVEVDEVKEHQEKTKAPAARSAGDGRRPSTASSETRSAQRTARIGRAASDLVRTVEAGLPKELREALPRFRPAVLRAIILQELKQRTPDQLVARADRRWYTWGLAAAADTSTGGTGLSHPVGAAVRLLGPYRCGTDDCGWECPDPRCEDCTIIDHGRPCHRCLEHRRDVHSKTVRQRKPRGPGQSAMARLECVDCGRPVAGPAQSDGTCNDCTQAAISALATLAQSA